MAVCVRCTYAGAGRARRPTARTSCRRSVRRGPGAVAEPVRRRTLFVRRSQLPAADYRAARGNAIHGLARWARWAPVSHAPESVTLANDLVPQSAWPFEVRVEMTYALHPEFGLVVTVRAATTVSARCPSVPASIHTCRCTASRSRTSRSWCPRLGAAPRRGLRPGRRPGRHQHPRRPPPRPEVEDLAPRRRVDRAGGARWARRRGGAYAVGRRPGVVRRDVPVPAGVHDGRLPSWCPALAIEPMTCPADAFNSGVGLIIIEPGGFWSGSWCITPLDR